MTDLDVKIFQALEKLTSALKSHLWEVAQQYRLSPIMIQFLLYINKHWKRNCTLSHLASEFSLTKATVSETIASLEKKGFIKKIADENDARVKYLNLTHRGRQIISQLEGYEKWFLALLKRFSGSQKENIYVFLVELLKRLKEQGKIRYLRSCLVCENFEKNKFPHSRKPHFCHLLNLRLSERDIQIDCPSNSSSVYSKDFGKRKPEENK